MTPKLKTDVKGNWDLYDVLITAKVPRILIFGPPGLGKSFTPWSIAEKMGWDFHSITLTDQTPASELRGHYILKGNEFVWHDGVITRAWRRSQETTVILELNEVIEASSDAETFLHNALDDPEFARLDLPTGETIRPSKDNLIIVGTMNGKPEHLREALRDRFPVTLEVKEPHPAAIASLPAELQLFAKEATKHDRSDRMSMRPIVAFANLRKLLGDPALAATAVWGPIRGKEILGQILSAEDSIKKTTK